jgi:hypothetical protein
MKLPISRRLAAIPVALWAIVFCLDTAAATLEYQLDLPADQMLSYRVQFEVTHPGRVRLQADWAPSRVLVFRLEGADGQTMRRSGPPPQRIEFEVGPDAAGSESVWTLTFSGLPTRRESTGRLLIELPDSPAIRKQKEDAAAPPALEPPPAPPWLLPVRTPSGLSPERTRVYETTERFRQLVADSSIPDAYRWQEGTLRYLAAKRDAAGRGNSPLTPSTRTTFQRIVQMARTLDDLRDTDEVALPGPAPKDAVKRRAWDRLRHPRFTPVEDQLDALMIDLERGQAPELESEEWIPSFLSSLLVCERYFEERARLGEHRASNRELSRRQWSRILAATDAMDALTTVD